MVMLLKALEASKMECVVYAFPGGVGTTNCVSVARGSGLLVEEKVDT